MIKARTYLNAILWATSNDCQYSSGEKKVMTRNTDEILTSRSKRNGTFSIIEENNYSANEISPKM